MRGDYLNAAECYSNAFEFNDQLFSVGNKYSAARAWGMAGKPDSAINNLKQEVMLGGFYDYEKLVNDKAFQKLHHLKEWNDIKREVKNNQARENEKLGIYKNIKAELIKLLDLDQVYRLQQIQLYKNAKFDTNENIKLVTKMYAQDASNVKYVSMLIDKYGWISYDTIGYTANMAIFLIIQHADSATQEKYLPVLRNAVKEKKAMGTQLALLEDRVLIRRGEKQIYGSQLQCDIAGKNCSVLPIEDEKNVDLRRTAIGLNLLSDYLKGWDIVYKVPD